MSENCLKIFHKNDKIQFIYQENDNNNTETQIEKEQEESVNWAKNYRSCIDQNYLLKYQLGEKKDRSLPNTSILAKYMRNQQNYAQKLVKNCKKQSCDWNQYQNYETFRDFYYNYETQSHFKTRFQYLIREFQYWECLGSELQLMETDCSHCGFEYQDTPHKSTLGAEIIDLQQPQTYILERSINKHQKINVKYIFQLQQKESFDLKDVLSIDLEDIEQDKIISGSIPEKIQNCLCGKMIEFLEKQRLISEQVLNQLISMKRNKNPLYQYLKSLRKDKQFDFLQFCNPDIHKITKNGISNSVGQLDLSNNNTSNNNSQNNSNNNNAFNNNNDINEEKSQDSDVSEDSDSVSGSGDEEYLEQKVLFLKRQANSLIEYINQGKILEIEGILHQEIKDLECLKEFLEIENQVLMRKKQQR